MQWTFDEHFGISKSEGKFFSISFVLRELDIGYVQSLLRYDTIVMNMLKYMYGVTMLYELSKYD